MSRVASRFVGAILAGGYSSRMGQPKHAIVLPDGRTMIQAVAEVMRAVPGCDDIVIVGSRQVCGGALRGVEIIEDVREHAGPLGGIEALLGSATAERCLLCGCDMPRLTTAMLQSLVSRAMQDDQPAMVVYQAAQGDVQPLPCMISAAALPIVVHLLDADRGSLRALISALGAARVALSTADERLVASFNTPADLAALSEDISASDT